MNFLTFVKPALFHKFSIKKQEIGILIHHYKSTGVSNGEAWEFVPGKTQIPEVWILDLRPGLRASGWQQAGRAWKAG